MNQTLLFLKLGFLKSLLVINFSQFLEMFLLGSFKAKLANHKTKSAHVRHQYIPPQGWVNVLQSKPEFEGLGYHHYYHGTPVSPVIHPTYFAARDIVLSYSIAHGRFEYIKKGKNIEEIMSNLINSDSVLEDDVKRMLTDLSNPNISMNDSEDDALGPPADQGSNRSDHHDHDRHG